MRSRESPSETIPETVFHGEPGLWIQRLGRCARSANAASGLIPICERRYTQPMNRRDFFHRGILLPFVPTLLAAAVRTRFKAAAEVLRNAVAAGPLRSAVLHVRQRDESATWRFGQTPSEDAPFLLGSITKPLCVAALMTLYDLDEFTLDDRISKFLPGFRGDGRDAVTIRHLLTHVSGLPDQLPDNAALRARHAGLNEFVDGALRVPLGFAPGSRYQYSSMAILIASHVAELISGTEIKEFVARAVLQPLGMNHSALGLGPFALTDVVPCQTEFGAPESGAGDPAARDWDWNSPYWRRLGAPWGGAHCSAADVGRFLAGFLHPDGRFLKPETARLMVRNHNPAGMTSRGLGFAAGSAAGSPGCSARTFGHTGSTGTLAWADPETDTVCVVLTSLPARARQPHPRDVAAREVAKSMK